jgi:hypothetical protein
VGARQAGYSPSPVCCTHHHNLCTTPIHLLTSDFPLSATPPYPPPGSDLAALLSRAVLQSCHVHTQQYLARVRELIASHDWHQPPVAVGAPLPLDAAFYQRWRSGQVKVSRGRGASTTSGGRAVFGGWGTYTGVMLWLQHHVPCLSSPQHSLLSHPTPPVLPLWPGHLPLHQAPHTPLHTAPPAPSPRFMSSG